jgi:hypothetical protein
MEQTNIAPGAAPAKTVVTAKLPSFSDLFQRTLKMYEVLFRKAVTLSLISALAIIPFTVVVFFLGLAGGQAVAVKMLLVLLLVASIAFVVYLASTVQAATLLLLEDGSRSVRELLNKGIVLAWPVIIVGFLTGLFTLFWALLLIIPGIIFSVYYSFSTYALVYEKQTGMAALKRSQQLVKNYWWAVVARTVYLGLVYLAVFLVVSLPLFILPENSALAIFWNMILSALRFITNPIFIIFTYLIFKELVNIKGSILKDAAQKTV